MLGLIPSCWLRAEDAGIGMSGSHGLGTIRVRPQGHRVGTVRAARGWVAGSYDLRTRRHTRTGWRLSFLELSGSRGTLLPKCQCHRGTDGDPDMTTERMRERIAVFLRAWRRLEEAAKQPKDEFIRDSVIQRFEFTYELAWNMLKQRLDAEGITVRTPRETWQQALLAGLIVDGNRWTDMQKMRNLTSHTYDEALADQVYGFVLAEGLGLFEQLADTAVSWQPNP